MISTKVGFYAQLKGKLTKKHYKVATIFVGHFSCLYFIHLQLDTSLEETMAAKIAFEQFDAEHRVNILHYCCDNWQFFDNAFSMVSHNARQKLTFCGITVHIHNGIVKRAIYNLSESARKQLLHTRTCWPKAVHFALWPYALAMLRTSTTVYQCWRTAH
jgi:hypothetical protein